MEFLVNDLSIHGQFSDLSSFRSALQRVMTIRQIVRRFGRDLYCHRNLADAKVSPSLSMPTALQALNIDERRALMQWLTRQGPFWEDIRRHGPDDYLECEEKIVTDSGVGEAAYCCFHGIERHLVSIAPSSWQISPVLVTWFIDSSMVRTTEVANHWDPDHLQEFLHAAPAPLVSWKSLEKIVAAKCPELIFAADAFEGLLGVPFNTGTAERILVLLRTLRQLKICHDEHGQRTAEGFRLYRDHFTGDKAWFSDSSDSEKRDFREKLTFRHPGSNGDFLFCSWHGKVKTPQIRIHFSWPVRWDEPVYVVYVGPKLTKR